MVRSSHGQPVVLFLTFLFVLCFAPSGTGTLGPGRASAAGPDSPGAGAGAPLAPPRLGNASGHFNVVDARSLNLPARRSARRAAPAGGRSALEKALGLEVDSSLREIGRHVDPWNNTHIRYQQTYGGVPIWGEHLLVHTDAAGNARATGRVIYQLDNRVRAAGVFRSVSARFSAEDAVEIAKRARGHSHPSWVFRNESVEKRIHLAEGDIPREVYVVDYFAEENGANPTRPFVLVDARSGDVVAEWEGLALADAVGPGGNVKTGRSLFGTHLAPLEVTQVGTRCSLENSRVKTVNLDHGTLGTTPFTFTCPENLVKEINGAFSPLNDAHFFAGLVFDMFDEWLGVAPLRFPITMRVHYGVSFENAFWNGVSASFGDGASRFYPLIDVNLSAHEVSHGFTEQSSGLIYAGQSGGINESFSDITGEAAEFYWKGKVDWRVGADIMKLVPGLRYFADPTLDGLSIRHASDFVPGQNVHHSSGVFNRAFYLLASAAGWSVRSAFEIFAGANQNYWTPNATFETAACGVLETARDLRRNVRHVDAAFQVVGVDCGYVPLVDVDSDGMDDDWETLHGLDPIDPTDAEADGDADGLVNLDEFHWFTDPAHPDSDGDGLGDGAEVLAHHTDALDDDTDDDQLSDGDEVNDLGTDPLDPDSDDDGLSDRDELFTHTTDPHDPDTDHDGMGDAFEVAFGFDPLADDGASHEDSDEDGVSNLREFLAGSDPTEPDSDGDGLSDGVELDLHGTAPTNLDSDGDGIPDGWEVTQGLDPRVDDAAGDADGDGWGNLVEFEDGTHPSDPLSRPVSLLALSIGKGAIGEGEDGDDDDLYQIDLRTGEATRIAATGTNEGLEALAFAPDQTLFALSDEFDRLVRVDPATGDATVVGGLGVSVREMGLASDDSGTLWMVDSKFASLYRVDSTTGSATRVGWLGRSGFDSLAWDGAHLYALHPGTNSLYTIDRNTGVETLVGPLIHVTLGAQTGLTTDSRGRLWGLSEHGPIFRVDKNSGLATPASTTISRRFASLALETFVDSDEDGMPDPWERLHGLDENDPSDALLDPDGDGLTNAEEFTAGSVPSNGDSDGDGLMDGFEVFTLGADPARVDSDGDGLSDGSEAHEHHTDPRNRDTDGDGQEDGHEINALHTDPLDPDDFAAPPAPVPSLPAWGTGLVMAALLGGGVSSTRRRGIGRA